MSRCCKSSFIPIPGPMGPTNTFKNSYINLSNITDQYIEPNQVITFDQPPISLNMTYANDAVILEEDGYYSAQYIINSYVRTEGSPIVSYKLTKNNVTIPSSAFLSSSSEFMQVPVVGHVYFHGSSGDKIQLISNSLSEQILPLNVPNGNLELGNKAMNSVVNGLSISINLTYAGSPVIGLNSTMLVCLSFFTGATVTIDDLDIYSYTMIGSVINDNIETQIWATDFIGYYTNVNVTAHFSINTTSTIEIINVIGTNGVGSFQTDTGTSDTIQLTLPFGVGNTLNLMSIAVESNQVVSSPDGIIQNQIVVNNILGADITKYVATPLDATITATLPTAAKWAAILIDIRRYNSSIVENVINANLEIHLL